MAISRGDDGYRKTEFFFLHQDQHYSATIHHPLKGITMNINLALVCMIVVSFGVALSHV